MSLRPYLFAAAVLALAACNREPAGYAPEVELNFMQACQAQAAAADGRCACIWDAIEANVAPADLAALERMSPAMREGHPLQREIEGYALACMGDGTAAPAPR